MTNKRFAKEWQGYRDKVLHPNSPAVQIEETERAFYAGAFSFLSLQMRELDSGEDVSEDDLRMMTEVHEELLAFFKGQIKSLNAKNGGAS